MMILAFFVFIVVPVSLLVFHLTTKKYLNPYKLIFVFAKKGQGKSTYLTKQALLHLRHGWTVYSTDPIPGCIFVPVEHVGYYEFEPHSLLIIDEIGMIWDNRNFKNFPAPVRDWFKLQRHRKVKVICASQSFDVDKKIRDLADDMFLLVKKFRVFSYGKRILKVLDIVEATGENNSESRIVDQLKFDSILFFWAGSRSLTFIPHWIPYFDSFAAPALLPAAEEWYTVPPVDLPSRRERFHLVVRSLLTKPHGDVPDVLRGDARAMRLACIPVIGTFLASAYIRLSGLFSRVRRR